MAVGRLNFGFLANTLTLAILQRNDPFYFSTKLHKVYCKLISYPLKGDYCHMEFPDDSFDGLYALESTCYAKKPVDVYKEVYTVEPPIRDPLR